MPSSSTANGNPTDAFAKAGWRTVSDIPSDEYTWPVGSSFYYYDSTLATFRRNEPAFGTAAMR